MAKQSGRSSTKKAALGKVEVKVPVTHVDYKIWSWPRRSLRFKILQDGRKKTCTRPGTLIDRTNTSKQWQGRGKRVLGGPRSSLRLPLTRDSGPISTAGHHAVRLPRFRTVYPTQREHGPVLIACFIRSTISPFRLSWPGTGGLWKCEGCFDSVDC